MIYLTFDEGGNDITYIKQIADVLKKNNVQATYFLTRNYIKTEADFIRQLVKDGNVIGNHSWHHYDMTTLANAASIDTFVAEITETEKDVYGGYRTANEKRFSVFQRVEAVSVR